MSDVDRSGRCFRCGFSDHRASHCLAESLSCPLCANLGLPAEHVFGGRGCAPHVGKKSVGRIYTSRMSSSAPVDGATEANTVSGVGIPGLG